MGTWSTIEIAGKQADVYEPAGLNRSRFAILHLHDFSKETLRGRPAMTRWLDELQMPCVCPHGQRCWWTNCICPEFDIQLTTERFILEHVMSWISSRWRLGPRSIGIQGIGMGGQGALRFAFKHPALFPVVAAIAPALDYHERYGEGTTLDDMYDSKEQCRQDTALMHVPPSNYPPHIFYCIDPEDRAWYRGNDRLHEKLNALGIPHEFDSATRAGGHSWTYFEQMAERAIRFIHAGLTLESRRLL